MAGMGGAWEYKVIKVRMHDRRARERALNRQTRDGWELDETTRGGLFARDQLTFRRWKATPVADAPVIEDVIRAPHRHEWIESSSEDGVRAFECSCGESRTVGR